MRKYFPYRISRGHWVWGRIGIICKDKTKWGQQLVHSIQVGLPGRWWLEFSVQFYSRKKTI